MSAAEVIEQFKALPLEEQQTVAEFVRKLPAIEKSTDESTVRYADPARVREISDKVFGENEWLFRKLAE